MSFSVHDFRVQLREKNRLCDELTARISEMKYDLANRNLLLRENAELIRKKDEIISIKESIIKEKDNQIAKLEAELFNLKNIKITSSSKGPINLIKPDNSLKNNIFSKRSNLTLSNFFGGGNDIEKKSPDLKSGFVNLTNKNINVPKSKRIAISAETTQNRFKSKESRLQLVEYPKIKITKDLISNAIFENDFMKNLEPHHIEKIVECMYPVEFKQNDLIIQEGDEGHVVYIMEGKLGFIFSLNTNLFVLMVIDLKKEGQVEVSKNGKVLCTIGNGKIFGELAILYNCTRTASIKGKAFD